MKETKSFQKNKFFITYHSELEGKIDPEFYRPEIASIKKVIRAKSSNRLKHYIQKMASGATPSIQEEEKFYSGNLMVIDHKYSPPEIEKVQKNHFRLPPYSRLLLLLKHPKMSIP